MKHWVLVFVFICILAELCMFSNGLSCIWPTQTVGKVKSCPESISEWERRKEIKNCSLLAQTQNCTDASNFEYHCVINEYEDALIEVCAQAKLIVGHCAEYNTAGMVIQMHGHLRCVDIKPPCAEFYRSTEAYKYPGCYDIVKRSQPPHFSSIDIPIIESNFSSTIWNANVNETNGSTIGSNGITWIIIAVVVPILIIAFGILVLLIFRKSIRRCAYYSNAKSNNMYKEPELLETDVQILKKWDQRPKTSSRKPLLSGRESTEEEKKADIAIVLSSISELSGHRNSDDEVSNWEKEDVKRKKPAKKNLKKAEERRKNVKQRPITGKETLEPEKKKREIKDKANSVSTRLANTHPFSKGTHNQKCVLSSYIKAEVSRSVGLIYIDNKPTGTGFRVGEMYIVTCAHVIEEVVSAGPHFIACDRMAIEFDRKKFNQRVDPSQVFNFRDISYLDKEHDFVVLELSCHQTGVGFPPPLTCFGEVALSEIHLVGHPGGREMKEDDIFPYWSTEHQNKIKELGNWSKNYFLDKKDYYSILLEPPRKILFDTTFDHGASGSPGVMIRDDKPCVVLVFAGGTPKYIFDNPYSTLQVKDHQKVEYGFPISDIFKKMWSSPQQNVKDLASNIFIKFI